MNIDKRMKQLKEDWGYLLPPGYDIDAWAPGDGKVRYRLVRLGETYWEAGDGVMTAFGRRNAENMLVWGGTMWVRGEWLARQNARQLRKAAYALLNAGHSTEWVEDIMQDADECADKDVVAEFVVQVRMDPCDKAGVSRMARALNIYGEALRRHYVKPEDAEVMTILVSYAKAASWEVFGEALPSLAAGCVRDAIAVLKGDTSVTADPQPLRDGDTGSPATVAEN